MDLYLQIALLLSLFIYLQLASNFWSTFAFWQGFWLNNSYFMHLLLCFICTVNKFLPSQDANTIIIVIICIIIFIIIVITLLIIMPYQSNFNFRNFCYQMDFYFIELEFVIDNVHAWRTMRQCPFTFLPSYLLLNFA